MGYIPVEVKRMCCMSFTLHKNSDLILIADIFSEVCPVSQQPILGNKESYIPRIPILCSIWDFHLKFGITAQVLTLKA